MSQDLALIEAAFALRESGTAALPTAQALHALLPPAISDVSEDEQAGLGAQILRQLVSDPHAMAFISAKIHGTGTSYKSFTPPLETIPAAVSVYECPVDHAYVWARLETSVPIPNCPDHPNATLVLRNAG